MRFVFFLLIIWQGGNAASVTADPLFDDDSLTSIRLTGDLSKLLKEKDKEQSYPALLTYSTATGSKELSVALQVRGNFRLEHCRIPGLRIVFNEPDAEGLFSKQGKLKLVTQCRRKSKLYEQYLLQEYLIYKIFGTLTPNSFKTRMVSVHYQDTGSKSREWSNLAFFIEDKKRMAVRLAATVVQKPRIRRDHLSLIETNLVSVFQYMIGNTDYAMLKGEAEEACCHNLKLLDKGAGYIPVPYDFDLAGLINTKYAAPPENLKIDRVAQRLYRGFCGGNVQLNATLALLQANKSQMYATLDHDKLSSRTVKKMHRFMDGFYKTVEDPKKLERKIIDKCRPAPRLNL